MQLLRPIYKYVQFATHGHCFPWDSDNRKACVQMLLDAARESLTRENYTKFKKDVQAELIGTDGAIRYYY
jgi:hypothetical protein